MYLNGTSYNIRASRHTATSLNPNMVVFGRENVMPADLVLCHQSAHPKQDNSIVEFVVDFALPVQMVRDHWGALMAACSWSPLHFSWYSFTRQDLMPSTQISSPKNEMDGNVHKSLSLSVRGSAGTCAKYIIGVKNKI